MTHLPAECLAVHGFYPRIACLYFDGSNSETSGSLLFVTLLTSCHAMNSSNCEGVKGAFFKIVGFACKRFLLSLPLPLHALFCARPNFPAAKKSEKCIERAESLITETLAMQAIRKAELWCIFVGQVSAHLHTTYLVLHICDKVKKETSPVLQALPAYIFT